MSSNAPHIRSQVGVTQKCQRFKNLDGPAYVLRIKRIAVARAADVQICLGLSCKRLSNTAEGLVAVAVCGKDNFARWKAFCATNSFLRDYPVAAHIHRYRRYRTLRGSSQQFTSSVR